MAKMPKQTKLNFFHVIDSPQSGANKIFRGGNERYFALYLIIVLFFILFFLTKKIIKIFTKGIPIQTNFF